MTEPLHHLHKRKRIHQNLEPYPHPSALKRIFDRIIYLAGIIGPLSAIPQAVIIYQTKDATGVSMITWGTALVLAVIWLFYGLLHKEKPIILTYILWILIELAIVAGIIAY